MRTSRGARAALGALAALGIATAGVAAQPGAAYAAASPPSLAGVWSEAVEQSSAELIARIDPGGAATGYRFEYGTTAAYGSSAPLPDGEIPAGAEAVAVGQQLTGLQPATTYHFRVLAKNEAGEVAGGDETFTTPPPALPQVSTGQAEAVTQSSAALTGTVDADGFPTTYEFDLGADTSYGIRIFGAAGSEAGAQTFRAPLQDLAPGATYHYRIVATNVFGTVYGADRSFTTSTYPSALLTAPAAPPLLAAILLAPEPSAGGKAAAGASSASAARAARLVRSAGAGHGRAGSRARRAGRGRHAPHSHGHAADSRTHERKGGR